MAINKKITKLLEDNKVKYEILAHRKVYTAFDASQTLKVHPKEIAKSLIVQVKRNFYMVILGADKNLDFGKIAKKFKVAQKDIKIPSEKILINKFKIKPGSAHVFASLYKIPTLIDKSFTNSTSGIFSSGSFTESFKIKLKDYLKIGESEIFVFGKAKKLKIQKAKPKKKQKKSKGKRAALKKKTNEKIIKKKKTKK
jgi:Ala-tRNA(Pro) deacylase